MSPRRVGKEGNGRSPDCGEPLEPLVTPSLDTCADMKKAFGSAPRLPYIDPGPAGFCVNAIGAQDIEELQIWSKSSFIFFGG